VDIRNFPEELRLKLKMQDEVEKIAFNKLVIKTLAEYLERKGVK
jgi:hypothetical protein